VPLAYTWFVNGVASSTLRDYRASFPAGTYAIALKIRSCRGADSSGTTFTITSPSSTPVSDFSASRLVLDVLEESQLSDLSLYGPTSWEWTASPSTGALFNDAYIANPKVSFIYAGQYQICLTTQNALGTGTTKCKSAYISVNDDQIFCTASSSSFPSGRITDEGGPAGDYSANTNCSFLINPCASIITLKFSQFSLADASDVLKVYDGQDNTATLIGSFNSATALPGGASGLTAYSGKMFLEWSTGAAGQSSGFSANWNSIPDTSVAMPVADFSFPAVIYTKQIVDFNSTTQGQKLSFVWDFDPPSGTPGMDGGNNASDRFAWNTAGSYDVKLTAINCGGADEVTKTITVVDPSSKPIVGFKANRLKAPVLNIITLTDTSLQGPFEWKWEVTPALTTNIIGSNSGKTLRVSFLKPGLYTVKLKATNLIGADSLTRVDYIEVFDYCTPVAGSLSSDIGISRVKTDNIDNYSAIGQNRYSTYLDDFTPEKVFKRDIFSVRLERNTISDSMNRKIWIDWNNDGDFADSLELAAFEPAAKTLAFTANISVPDFAAVGYTTMRIGTSYGSGNNSPCGINPTGEFEDYPLEIATDDIKPVIILNGPSAVTLEQWHQYTEAGATATDNVDGNISALINISSTVDSSVAGLYTVRYNVTDAEGNKADEVTRTVTFTPDITPPVITLTGNPVETVTVNTSYADPGATATDYLNRSLTGSILAGDNIDLTIPGTYHIWYTVSDAAGNKDSATRVVNVVDDVDPTLTLIGPDTIIREVFSFIDEPGYGVADNFHQTVTVVVDSSMVITSKVGLYPMTYTATDPDNNSVTITRWVKIQDITKPVITLIGDDSVYVEVFSSYPEQGAIVTDNYCTGPMQWIASGSVNTSKLGEYYLTYNVTDCQGNNALTLTRTVIVVDTKAPVLTLNGFGAETIQRWKPYTDPGVSITDNYYTEASLLPLVQVTSNLNVDYPGLYSICYQVTDSSGNKSEQVCRTIIVNESTSSIDEKEEINVKVYPNPNSGKFILYLGSALGGEASIQVMTAQGIILKTIRAATNTEQEISLNDYAAGIYLLRISYGNHVIISRVQIIR
jgi:PKD repeat protein